MVHRSMKDDSRVADKSYIKRVLLALEGFLFILSLLILLYSKASYDFETASTLVLSDFLETNLERFVFSFDITFELPISPTLDLARYTRTSLTTLYLILNVPASIDRV